ncbi:MAG: YraN family protein [Bacteroidota bacterium]
MAGHNLTGKTGELLAATFFSEHGYAVLEKNWRHSRWEVDIIASKNNVLHFVEVKTRRTKNYGLPEEKVGNKKIQNLINAAEEYLYLHPEWKRIQFDILSIILSNGNAPEYFLIEDVHL